jgi:LEA14-like dessication related protein
MRGKGLMIAGIIAGLSGIAFGVYTLYKRQIYLAMQYCYKLYKINLTSFTKDLIQMEIQVKILNRSSFQLTIKSYSFDISINNNLIAKIKSDQDTIINPVSSNLLKVNVNVKPGDVLKGQFLLDLIKYYLLDKSKIIIKVKGTLIAQVNFLIAQLPIDYQSNLKELTAPPDPAKESENLTCPKNF